MQCIYAENLSDRVIFKIRETHATGHAFIDHFHSHLFVVVIALGVRVEGNYVSRFEAVMFFSFFVCYLL